MLRIDGSRGEGGGQLVRQAVALAAITRKPVKLLRARANRHPPGLAPQHVAAVQGVADLCGAETRGLQLRAQTFEFVPGPVPGGRYKIDVGTAGSVALVLQAVVPVALSAAGPVELAVTGGTDVHRAPAWDYTASVWVRTLRCLGLDVTLEIERRGYFPRGGGLVRALVRPGTPSPLSLPSRGSVREIRGVVHASNLPAHIPARMLARATERLERYGPVALERQLLGDDRAVGAGGAVAVWADCGNVRLGASAVARRGVPAEAVADEAVASLVKDLEAGATLDLHASDQILIHLALADGPSDYVVRSESCHASTIVVLLQQFLPVRWQTEATAMGGVRCTLHPL